MKHGCDEVYSFKDSTYATGKRKGATAKVWIRIGTGIVRVNNKDLSDYFVQKTTCNVVMTPLTITNNVDSFDVFCVVSGGGFSGQAGAFCHGISKALNIFDPEKYHAILKQHKLLMRDSRVVERKKYGKSKARKSFQFSKR